MEQSNTRLTRRAFAGALPVFLVGCSALSSEDQPPLHLTVFNHAESPFTIEFTLLRSDGDRSRSDARTFDGRIDVPPDGEANRENVAPTRRYLVQYTVYENNKKRTDQGHFHYYPKADETDNTATFDLYPPGTLFRRW